MNLWQGRPEAVGEASSAQALDLLIAFGDYDRTRPLIDGRVRPRGVNPTYRTEWIGHFCTRPVYEEYDVAEMSLSWYVAARCRGEPVVALPIFPLRMPVHAYMFCRADAPYMSPRDLVGKRVAVPGYRYTVNLWLRGILQDVYGVSPDQIHWVTGEREGAGYVIPPGIDVTLREGQHPETLLRNGEVDAVFSPEILPAIQQAEPWVRRLFPDAEAELAQYVKSSGILPITHTMVVGTALHARAPWLAESLMTAFREAQAIADEAQAEPKYFSDPAALFAVERQRARYGAHVYAHGMAAPNRHIIETFVRYAHEQGYIDRRPSLEELFAPGTLDL